MVRGRPRAMPPSLSTNQIDELGRRLRKGNPTPDDLKALQQLRREHDPALQEAERRVSEMGLEPTSRLKTPGTIIDKLVRAKTRLSKMQDLAGLRVVEDMDRREQDKIVERVVRAFPECETKIVDRRTAPSNGYRAVHVVVRIDEFWVEIQVRTALQDMWAQVFDQLSDRYGREIRYGHKPSSKGAKLVVKKALDLAELIAKNEKLDADRFGFAKRLLKHQGLRRQLEHELEQLAEMLEKTGKKR